MITYVYLLEIDKIKYVSNLVQVFRLNIFMYPNIPLKAIFDKQTVIATKIYMTHRISRVPLPRMH